MEQFEVIRETTIKRMMEKFTEMRISTKGAKVLKNAAEKFIREVTVSAARFAEHGKRTTIKEEDVLLALETRR